MLKQIFRDSFLNLREKNQDTNKIIYIFKGFPHDWLQEISDFKLLTIPLHTSLLSLDLKKQQNIIDFFTQASVKNHHWLTYEEFQTIPSDNISIVGTPIIINNNFYDAYYPLSYSIPPEHLDIFHNFQVDSKNNNEDNYLFSFYSSIEVSPKKNIYVSYVTK